VQIAIDVILLFIVCFYLIRDRRIGGEHPFKGVNEKKLELLSDSFNEMIQESKRILGELSERMESKKEEIDRSIQEADRLLIRLEKTTSPCLINDNMDNDKYQKILELADEGLRTDEISGVVRLPKGEVELVLGLRKE